MFARNLLPVLAAGLIAVANSAAAAPADRAWVEMAPGSGSIVRVLTMAESCPVVTVDGRPEPMAKRAAPAQLAPRPNKAQVAGGASFPDLICELPLPRNVRRASLAGAALPLPPARIDRIVLIGDTGCRLKDADKAWQSCNDPAQWPFAAIAAKAAALHPDLVLHVGDYLYRENPCTAAHAGCAGAVWGYGEAGWQADFLDPAAALLAAAPWVMVRGNHEECLRAGQGWWRLLDPHPLLAGQDCNDAANDVAGNHTDPYAVELGGGARLIVADLIEMASVAPTDPALAAAVRADWARIDTLASGARDSFVTAHYPFNAVLWNKDASAVVVGSKPVSAFAPPLPSHFRAMLAGHIHLFQYAGFADRPIQVITGFSGTQEDPAIGPGNLADIHGKPGGEGIRALTTVAGRFGSALMERDGRRWRLTVYAADGTIMGHYPL
jgi:hypothetical protein